MTCVCRRPSWTPKTQPNGSSAVVWLSFWCSTRFTRKKVTRLTGKTLESITNMWMAPKQFQNNSESKNDIFYPKNVKKHPHSFFYNNRLKMRVFRQKIIELSEWKLCVSVSWNWNIFIKHKIYTIYTFLLRKK